MEFLWAAGFILAGLLLLFSGYSFYKGSLFLMGFMIGFVFGATVCMLFTPLLPVIAIGAVAGGLLGAILFKFVEIAAFAILGGWLGAFLGHTLAYHVPSVPHWVVVAIFATVLALLAIIFKRPAVIGAISLLGSAFLVLGAAQLITGDSALAALQTGNISQTLGIIILIIALIGAVAQSGSQKNNSKGKSAAAKKGK